jgi:hypothetical protein
MIKTKTISIVLSFVATIILAMFVSLMRVDALSSSSLQLSDPRPGQTGVTYTFQSSSFTTGTTIECIDLFLNTEVDGSGSAVGTTTSSSLLSSSLITAGSWSINNAVNGRLRITNATGQTPAASGNIVFGGITNSASEDTYYGVFTTYTDDTCTTPSGGVDSVSVAFVIVNGSLVSLTIDPTLTFTVQAVAVSQAVNGATTNTASTATGIDFQNNVTSSTNGISAHDLIVGTNATGGYSVFVRHTGDLSNGSDTIANHTGTNALPTVFSAVGTESWGYTTNDFTLDATADRFDSNLWAGFTTSNGLVAYNGAAPSPSPETTRVGHQVGVSSGTPAGTYQTTIIYTATSVY